MVSYKKNLPKDQNQPKDPLVGTYFGNYRLTQLLGEGGMGRVYKASHPLHKEVAVKVLSENFSDDREFVERFLREIHVLQEISHPNIVQYIAADIKKKRSGKDIVYLVTEYLDGRELDAVVQGYAAHGQVLPWELVRSISFQICDALSAVHERNIVHRDLKPGNVMLISQEKGRDNLVKLLDFGIARHSRRQAGGSERVTRAGFAVGTPEYMSPEQAQGGEADHRSDIYSLGTLLYEMVTGRVPFEDETSEKVLISKTTTPPPLPSRKNPGVILHSGVEDIIMQALARSPEGRFQSMQEFKKALSSVRMPAVVVDYEVGLLDTVPVQTVDGLSPAATGNSLERGALPQKDALPGNGALTIRSYGLPGLDEEQPLEGLLEVKPTPKELQEIKPSIKIEEAALPAQQKSGMRNFRRILGWTAAGCVLLAGSIGAYTVSHHTRKGPEVPGRVSGQETPEPITERDIPHIPEFLTEKDISYPAPAERINLSTGMDTNPSAPEREEKTETRRAERSASRVNKNSPSGEKSPIRDYGSAHPMPETEASSPLHSSTVQAGLPPDPLPEILSLTDIQQQKWRLDAEAERCSREYEVSGTADLTMLVSNDGSVLEARVASSLADTPLAECIVKAAKEVQFPRFGQGAMNITLPYEFSAAGEEEKER